MNLLQSSTPVPDWWRSSAEDVDHMLGAARKGTVRRLALSHGGRHVRCVVYGQWEEDRMGPANFNSALAAGRPEAYCRRSGGARPVLFVLAGVHGQEVEGIAAALSLIKIMETGTDAMGNDRSSLKSRLEQMRLIIIPLANPDGRARMPYAGWAGLPGSEMTKWGQGTRANGEPYGWPGCKAVHPMRGDVGLLGAYFDDAGVNLMHDTWHAPMSDVTKAILTLVADEGPDMLLNLHSHSFHPHILPENYIPVTAKRSLNQFARACYAKMHASGYKTGPLPGTTADETNGPVPPPFALNSMLWHTGCGMPVLYESPHGCTGHVEPYGYEDILLLHHMLFDCAAEYLLNPIEK